MSHFSKNFVEIIGNLGDNPKYLLSSQNQPRFVFDVCASEPYKEGDEWKSKSTWVKCTAWGNLATTLSRMQFAKGERVMVEGKLRNNNWVNSQTNEQHNEMYVLVVEMRKMASPKSSKQSKQGSQTPQSSLQREADFQQQQDLEELNDSPF